MQVLEILQKCLLSLLLKSFPVFSALQNIWKQYSLINGRYFMLITSLVYLITFTFQIFSSLREQLCWAERETAVIRVTGGSE